MFLEAILWTFAIYGFTMFFKDFIIDIFTIIFRIIDKMGRLLKKSIAKLIK